MAHAARDGARLVERRTNLSEVLLQVAHVKMRGARDVSLRLELAIVSDVEHPFERRALSAAPAKTPTTSMSSQSTITGLLRPAERYSWDDDKSGLNRSAAVFSKGVVIPSPRPAVAKANQLSTPSAAPTT